MKQKKNMMMDSETWSSMMAKLTENTTTTPGQTVWWGNGSANPGNNHSSDEEEEYDDSGSEEESDRDVDDHRFSAHKPQQHQQNLVNTDYFQRQFQQLLARKPDVSSELNRNGSQQEQSSTLTKHFQVGRTMGGDSVDEFLAKTGPQLKQQNKSWEKQSGFDVIKKQQKELRKMQSGLVQPQQTQEQQDKVMKNNSNGSGIDYTLLQQAFRYTGQPSFQVNSHGIMDESVRAPPISSISALSKSESATTLSKSAQMMLAGQQKKHPLARSVSQNKLSRSSKSKLPTTKPFHRKSNKTNKKKKKMPYDLSTFSSNYDHSEQEMERMLENFEKGTTLKALQKELESSKQSLYQSDTFIRTATQKWFTQAPY